MSLPNGLGQDNVCAMATDGAAGCGICLGNDAANFNASAALRLPPPFAFLQTCGALEVLAQGLNTAQCEVIQGMGSLCGCSTRTNSSVRTSVVTVLPEYCTASDCSP